MKTLLHIIATPRLEESRTLAVSREFLKVFTAKHPACAVKELNLFQETLPAITAERAAGKYVLLTGGELDGALRESWNEIVHHIERFLEADVILISTPMWNFSIPYVLKQYIDIICQPRYLFHYTADGPEGLVLNRKMVVITSRGGDYSEQAAQAMDLQEPYLRTIFGFIGINDSTFIHAQPMDAMGPEMREQRLREAMDQAARAAETV